MNKKPLHSIHQQSIFSEDNNIYESIKLYGSHLLVYFNSIFSIFLYKTTEIYTKYAEGNNIKEEISLIINKISESKSFSLESNESEEEIKEQKLTVNPRKRTRNQKKTLFNITKDNKRNDLDLTKITSIINDKRNLLKIKESQMVNIEKALKEKRKRLEDMKTQNKNLIIKSKEIQKAVEDKKQKISDVECENNRIKSEIDMMKNKIESINQNVQQFKKVLKSTDFKMEIAPSLQIILENTASISYADIKNIIDKVCDYLSDAEYPLIIQNEAKQNQNAIKELLIDFLYRFKDKIFDCKEESEQILMLAVNTIQFLYDHTMFPCKELHKEYTENIFNSSLRLPDFDTLNNKIGISKEAYDNLHNLFYHECIDFKENADNNMECDEGGKIDNSKVHKHSYIENELVKNITLYEILKMTFNPFTFLFDSTSIDSYCDENKGILIKGCFILNTDKNVDHTVGIFLRVDSNGYCFQGSQGQDNSASFGRIIYPNGDIYKGTIRNQEMHGSGLYSFHKGHQYLGEFKDNLICGKGVLLHTNGDIFSSNFDTRESDRYGWSNYNKIELEKKENAWVFILQNDL